jgi:hypothetical protein
VGCPRRSGATAPGLSAEAEAENKKAQALAAQAEALFAKRDDLASLRGSIGLYEKAALRLPDPALQVRLARAYELTARQIEGRTPRDDAERLRLYQAGRESAEKALAGRYPGILAELKSRPEEALARMLPEDGPYLFWYALLRWREASAQGAAAQIANREDILRAALRAEALAPNLLGRAPARLLGEIYALLPRFAGGDLSLARSYFEASFQEAPGVLENRASCANTYAVRVDVALARTFYEEILSADPSAPPELAPENRIEQRLATRSLSALRD